MNVFLYSRKKHSQKKEVSELIRKHRQDEKHTIVE